MEYTRMNDRPH